MLVIQILGHAKIEGEVHLKKTEIPLCLAFPSVKLVLAVLTLRELFLAVCGHREQALLKEEVESCSVLGAAGGCVCLLVLA